MRNIFFDLDGTLIDSRKRLYLLFQALVSESDLTFEDYWVLKRSKNSHEKMLTGQFEYDKKKYADFEKKWLNLIETREYLDNDTIYAHVPETLEKLQRKFILNIITARQSIENTHWQLKKLGLYHYFNTVLITEHKSTKTDLLTGKTNPDDCMVGDTGYDILTGKALNINTVALTYGFVSREKLMEYKPDFLIDDFSELYKYLVPE